jgi:uncharacterized protein YndB with AHSA1/START domain
MCNHGVAPLEEVAMAERPIECPIIERRITLPATPDEVWTALTDPAEIGSWFEADVEWELRPGGAARFSEPDGTERAGTVVTVRQGEELRFRWWPENEDSGEPASEVTYALEEVPEGTRLTVTEEPLEGVVASSLVSEWDFRLLFLSIRSEARLAVRL